MRKSYNDDVDWGLLLMQLVDLDLVMGTKRGFQTIVYEMYEKELMIELKKSIKRWNDDWRNLGNRVYC